MKRLALAFVVLASAANAREGFFPVGSYRALADSGVSAKTVAETLPTVGKLTVDSPRRAGWREMESLRTGPCAGDFSRSWNRDECAALGETCSPEGSCPVLAESPCSGVAVEGFFVTVSYCARGLAHAAPRAKFIGEDGLPYEVRLATTALTESAPPNDLSLFRMIGDDRGARLRGPNAKEGEEVFSVGFPRFDKRERKRSDYAAAWGVPRVSFGKVLPPPPPDEIPEKDRGTRFIADADLTSGMAGAPLFDKRGRLIGLAYDGFDEARPAAYAGAKRVRELISSLADAEKLAAAAAAADAARSRLEEARALERDGRWAEAEAAYRDLKARYGNLPNGEGDYARAADKELRFVGCETARRRPRRTFPRVEYLESVALSAMADGSRERLLELLPCRARTGNGDAHAEDLVDALLDARVNGVPPLVRERAETADGTRAVLGGMSRPAALLWRREGDQGWALAGAILE